MIESPPAIIIQDDRGGLIGDYMLRVMQAKAIHAKVEIRGKCYSSCTLWTSLPDVCVGPQAQLGFHSASIPSTDGVLIAYYPQSINQWLKKRGGLNSNIKFLAAPALQTMFKECD